MTASISSKVNELTSDEKMFTAFDVTVSLRNDGEHIEHKDVKQIVHEIYENQDMDPAYDRTAITVPNTNVQAFLYYHITSDPDDYEPIKKNYIPITKSQKTTTKGLRTKQPVDGSLDDAMPTSEGRLNIPSKLIKDAGLDGKVVDICYNGLEIIITPKRNKNHISRRECKAQDFRLSSGVMSYINVNKNVFEIKTDGKVIIVK